MAVYEMSRYPRTAELRDGRSVTLRPMVKGDRDALLAFFRAIPSDQRFFVKDDVASPDVVGNFCEHLNYDRALPLLAVDGDRIVADAVLVRHRGSFLGHKGEIRLLIAPDWQGVGCGSALIRDLVEIAADAELEHVDFELIRGFQDAMIEAACALGAFEVGHVSEYAKDAHGGLHDLVFLRIPLGKWWQWAGF